MREIEERLFGSELAEHDRPAPEAREAEQHSDESAEPLRQLATIGAPSDRRRRPRGHRDGVWRAIEETPDFWTTLKPLEEGAIARPVTS